MGLVAGLEPNRVIVIPTQTEIRQQKNRHHRQAFVVGGAYEQFGRVHPQGNHQKKPPTNEAIIPKDFAVGQPVVGVFEGFISVFSKEKRLCTHSKSLGIKTHEDRQLVNSAVDPHLPHGRGRGSSQTVFEEDTVQGFVEHTGQTGNEQGPSIGQHGAKNACVKVSQQRQAPQQEQKRYSVGHQVAENDPIQRRE